MYYFILSLYSIGVNINSVQQVRQTASIYEPSREKTNIMASAKCIDQDQPAHSAQAYPGRYIPSQGHRGIE